MAEVDPQQFGEVKANVDTLVASMRRVELVLGNVVTKEVLETVVKTITTDFEKVEGKVNGFDVRLQAIEDAIKLEKASMWTRIRTVMASSVVSIVGWGLVIGLGGMVVSYFVSNYRISQTPIESKTEGGK